MIVSVFDLSRSFGEVQSGKGLENVWKCMLKTAQ